MSDIDHPFGHTNFELRELAGHPHVWEEADETLVTEQRLTEYPDWVATGRFFLGSGTPVLVGLTLHPATLYPWPPSAQLTPKVIRSVKTTDLYRQVRDALKSGPQIGLAVEAEAEEFRTNRRPGRARRPDLFYAQIANRYIQLVPGGSPTKRLAQEMGVSQSQARDLIHEARRRKLLTGSQRGQAGGELTPKALRILARDQEDG